MPHEEKELAAFMEEGSRQERIAEPLDWEETTLPQHWKIGDRFAEYDWYEDTGMRVVRETGAIWETLEGESCF
jgi:alpha-galactosidase